MIILPPVTLYGTSLDVFLLLLFQDDYIALSHMYLVNILNRASKVLLESLLPNIPKLCYA